MAQQLKVEAAPIPENPNHANVVNWPADKAEQKMKALEIAAASRFIVAPDRTASTSIAEAK
ncbi:MAG TPA: hypothetical protein VHR66_27795 [Gemmataceae bacterium]|jgi:hypothetical protein|nr:hypothetical protein [Gemmataceae bacterium]